MQPRRPKKKHAARRRRLPLSRVALVGVTALVVVFGVILIGDAFRGSDNVSGNVVVTPGVSAHVARQEGNVLGEPDAPVTVIEYFSYYCGHCGRFSRETAPQIEREFVELGLVRHELHPLATQGEPLWAAEGCACAGEQGLYWDYHDLLFANQHQGAYEIDKLKGYAAQLGLDTGSFNTCLDSHKYREAVVNESTEVFEAGITSTPTFFIGSTEKMRGDSVPYSDHTRLVGAHPYDVFKKAIEEALENVQ